MPRNTCSDWSPILPAVLSRKLQLRFMTRSAVTPECASTPSTRASSSPTDAVQAKAPQAAIRLDPSPGPRHRLAARGEAAMRGKVGMTLAVAMLAGGCSQASRCPVPVHYDAATLKKIEHAREALPKDSVLLQVLADYEDERDDLRFCR